MIERRVRIGTVADQDTFRRDDVRAMSPNERLMHLIRWRDAQFGPAACRIRNSGVVSYRRLPPPFREESHAART